MRAKYEYGIVDSSGEVIHHGFLSRDEAREAREFCDKTWPQDKPHKIVRRSLAWELAR
jgi:hypothetical protein